MRLLHTLSLLFILNFLTAQVRFEADFNTFETGSAPYWLTTIGDRVFFSATDGFSGNEPWIYDPAVNQAYRLADINPAAASSTPRDVVVVDDVLYFVATSINQQQIWRLLPGANQVEPVSTDSTYRRITSLVVYDNALYFRGNFSSDAIADVSLHRYRFDDESTEQVTNTNPALGLASSFLSMQVHNDQLYLLGRKLDGNLSALVSYDATNDTFNLVPNQLIENGQQVQVTDFRSLNEYLIMNIRDPEDLNSAYLGIYDTVTKIINIRNNEPLWNQNPPVRSIEVVGELVYFRKRSPSRTLLRSYNPANLEVQTIPGITDNDRIDHIEENEGELLIFSSSNLEGFRIRAYAPATNDLTTIPLEESFVQDFRGRTFRVFAQLGDDWFYQGGTEENPELFRFRENNGSVDRLTDIHTGTIDGSPRLLQRTNNGNLLLRTFAQSTLANFSSWVNYDPNEQSFTGVLPELDWTFDSKVYQLPGYLVMTQVSYAGVDYEAVTYDSLTGTIIPIIERSPNCNGAFTRTSGTYILYNNALYFPHCVAGQLQLHRHQFGVEGAEQISDFTQQSLFKGTLFDETIGTLGEDLIMPIGELPTSYFSSDLYRFDGTDFTQIDLSGLNVREPIITQAATAIYLTVTRNSLSNYYPAYLREGDDELHFMTYQEDTIKFTFPSVFFIQDTTAYLISNNQVLRHTPASEDAELYYDIPNELDNAYSPYLFNGRLYFVATDPVFGSELYEVNDLNDAPQRVSDINLGRPGSQINSFEDNGERLFFAAVDGYRGSELWSYQPNCFTIDLTTEPTNISWPTGSVEATPADGTAPFTYTWNTGQTTALLQGLAAGFYEVTITDANGCSTSQSTWLETNGIISNTSDEGKILTATVFPNPFSHSLSINIEGDLTGDMTTELFTINGQLVQRKKFTSGQRISLDVNNLPSGTFVIRLSDSTGRTALLRKVVKK